MTLRTLMESWSRFAVVPADRDTCWMWNGSVESKGYGRLHFGGKALKAHRVAYELHRGRIPQGLTIDHLCRNRRCVNPWHLEVVTNRENVLRGEGITAQYARATHCVNGHPFDAENTYMRPEGHRECRACRREQNRKFRRSVSANPEKATSRS